MKSLDSAIRAEQGLFAWMKSGLWRRGFDRGSLTRAEAYANARTTKVTEVAHTPGESVIAEARVKGSGSASYLTRVGLFKNGATWKIEAECECPVGHYCKHGAALVMLAMDRIEPRKVIAPVAPSKRVIDPRLDGWISQMESVPEEAAGEKSPVLEKRFLAYCLVQSPYHHDTRWQLSMRVANRLKNGGFSVSGTHSRADPTNPPKYLTREDFIPISLYHQRYRKHALWSGEMKLEDGDWEDLLDSIEATGRFFCERPRDHAWVPVTTGPVERVEATWEIRGDGSARPVLKSDHADRVILPTRPLRYLDAEAGTIGLLESDLPSSLLELWRKGPEIPATQIAQVTERLRVAVPAVPPPVVMETIELPATAPQPHLMIEAQESTVGLPFEDVILGTLRFRYGEGPAIRPMAADGPAPQVYSRGGRRYVQPRNARAEEAAIDRLLRMGLVPLGDSFVPAEPFPSMRAAWMDLLEDGEIGALREAGWTITIDPKSGLVFRDAGAFFGNIESDPAHGIDWFRFDAAFELDGKRFSLIPIIAQAIRANYPAADSPELPEFYVFPCENPEDGSVRFPAKRLMEMVDQVRHLFHGTVVGDGPLSLDRMAAAGIAEALAIDSSETARALAKLGRSLKSITELPAAEVPSTVLAELRPYQQDGFRWLAFLAAHGLHGILADDMGLGKTLQTLAYLAASRLENPELPSLVVAPTSVVPNWAAEAEKFTPHLKIITLHGKDRAAFHPEISTADLVLTSYPLLVRDFELLGAQSWQTVVLDEAQYIKNPKAITAVSACRLKARQRLCLSGTPMENHLGELWSLMRFLMPGFLGDEKSFNIRLRRPIERDRSMDAQLALNRRVSPLILRRTKDEVATELPAKTELIHHVDLTKKQTDLYESVRAAMDKRVRDAIASNGLAKSHIIVLDALLKLRQICCHPQLLKTPAAAKVKESAKLEFLTDELLPTLLEEGRRILIFSSFTSMLALIEAHLVAENISFLKLTGQTKDRAALVKTFQSGAVPIFLISLKAGGTGLNLTAADTVIHFDPWWNPAAENQATDRAHRIGQTKPVFVHKLVCRGTIEDRILELQKHKAGLVEALLSEETSKLRIDPETLSHLLAPLE